MSEHRPPMRVNPVTGKMESVDIDRTAKRDGCMVYQERYLQAARDAGLGNGEGVYGHFKSLKKATKGQTLDMEHTNAEEKPSHSNQVRRVVQGRSRVVGLGESKQDKSNAVHFNRTKGVVNTFSGAKNVNLQRGRGADKENNRVTKGVPKHANVHTMRTSELPKNMDTMVRKGAGTGGGAKGGTPGANIGRIHQPGSGVAVSAPPKPRHRSSSNRSSLGSRGSGQSTARAGANIVSGPSSAASSGASATAGGSAGASNHHRQGSASAGVSGKVGGAGKGKKAGQVSSAASVRAQRAAFLDRFNNN